MNDADGRLRHSIGLLSTPRRQRVLASVLLGAALLVAAACAGGDDSEPLDGELTPTTPDATVGDEDEVEAGEIAIDADAARPLDRRLFGTNVPAWLGADKLADPAFQAATTALGTTLLRFPGGSWSNGYDWLACERGDEPECFAIWAARPSDFVGFMQATGLPGVWTTSFSGTAEEAAAAVAFFNGDVDDDRALGVDREGRDWKTVGEWARLRVAGGHRQPAEIELWEVGNEVYGARPAAGPDCAEFGWEDVWTCDGTKYVQGDDAHDGYLEFRDAMRTVDPEIEVGAVGLFDGESWGSWGTEVIAGAGDLLDFYVIHHYGFGGEPDSGEALEVPQQVWPELMQVATATLAAENPSRTVPIAITEYNMVAFQDADEHQLMARAINLLYIADTIGQMAENGVTIASQWNLANGKAPNGTDYGMIDTDTGARNPQYYALALWTALRRRVARHRGRVRRRHRVERLWRPRRRRDDQRAGDQQDRRAGDRTAADRQRWHRHVRGPCRRRRRGFARGDECRVQRLRRSFPRSHRSARYRPRPGRP